MTQQEWEALQSVYGPQQSEREDIEEIAREVCALADVSIDDVLRRNDRPRRKKEIAHARQMVMYIAHLRQMTYVRIGELLNGLDHTTVLHGVRAAKQRVEQARKEAQ